MPNDNANLPATEYLAGKPNVNALASAAITAAVAGPIAMKPNSMGELMEFAKLMAMSRGSIPACLRGNPADCLAVAMDAYAAGLSPFALAKDAYKVGDVIAYGAKSTIAMLYALAPLDGRLHLEWEGEGEKLVCTVTGKLRGDPRPKVLPVEIKSITVRNSPMWKQQPKLQLGYWAQRAWARLYCPEATLGAPCIEDVEAGQQMQDVTPTGTIPRTATAQLAHFAAPRVEDHDPIPQDPTYPLVNADGEVVLETTSAAAWLGEFEKQLKVSDVPRALWKANETALEWAADMVEGGDETVLRLRKAYLERPAPDQKDAPAGKVEKDDNGAEHATDGGGDPDDWAAEMDELRRIGSTCKTYSQWMAFAEDHAERIDALIASEPKHADAWKAFANELVAGFQPKKGGKA